MKYFATPRHYLSVLLIAVACLLGSCGPDGRHFKIDGHLLNLNQGEFYVYSPDGSILHGIDTIKVQAGRFTYLAECDRPMTLVIVFPNFTEQPVFAQPGKSVDIKGDASHLKEMTVKGTKDNELMNKFREQVASASPAEMTKYARQFVEDHPESAAATWLVRRYFIATDKADIATATRLLRLVTSRQKDNIYAQRLLADCEAHKPVGKDGKLPSFTAYDIKGKVVSNATLAAKPTVVVQAWTTWNYSSTSMLRTLATKQRDSKGSLSVIGVCLDPGKASCLRTLKMYDADNTTTICDGKMVDGTLYNKLGMFNMPDNLLIKNGKIVARNLTLTELQEKLETDK